MPHYWLNERANSGRGQYGAVPISATGQSMGNKPTDGPPAVSTVYRKELDCTLVESTRRMLTITAILCLVLITGMIVGASLAGTVSLFVNISCLFAVLSRQLFLVFMLSTAGTFTSEAPQCKHGKYYLFASLGSSLVTFSILGGSLYVSVRRLIAWDFTSIQPGAFLITSSVSLPVMAVLCGLIGTARKLDDKKESGTAGRAALPRTTVTTGATKYRKEKGLILRRNLNLISVRSIYYFSLILLLQSLVTFIGALIAYFKPRTLVLDSVMALSFAPLAVLMTVKLLFDMITLLTEGISQGAEFGEVAESLISIEGVTAVRHLRIWSRKTDQVGLSVQIAIDEEGNVEAVSKKANELLKMKYDIYQYKIDSVDDFDVKADIQQAV